jgi:hypothetical protein
MAKPRHVQKSVEISRPSKIPFAGWISGASSPDAVHKPKRHLEHGIPLDYQHTL